MAWCLIKHRDKFIFYIYCLHYIYQYAVIQKSPLVLWTSSFVELLVFYSLYQLHTWCDVEWGMRVFVESELERMWEDATTE
jgi:hypothetical protein